MREFAVPYQDGLMRGLRRFPVSQRNEEWLVECHNLMPSEVGLIPHETIVDINIGTGYLLLETGGHILLETDDDIIVG